MIHQPMGGAQGQAEDIKVEAAQIVRINAIQVEFHVPHWDVETDRGPRDFNCAVVGAMCRRWRVAGCWCATPTATAMRSAITGGSMW